MPPGWLTVLSWLSLAAAVSCGGWILWDIYARGHRQQMGVMEAVWPVTALYLGPVAVWGYRRFGRPKSPRWRDETGAGDGPTPGWASVATGVSHCGAGCTLGDLVAEWVVWALGAAIAGQTLLAEYVGDYIAALALGILFQYFAIAPMRDLGPREGLVRAAQADVGSLTAFEVGLFGWMAVVQLVLFPRPHLEADRAAYWLLMQVGMVVGFATAWPANVWLIRRGIKEAM